MGPRALKLPACERCQIRKIKCDKIPPKCSSCSKSSKACIIIDPQTGSRYTRDGLYQLEQKLQRIATSSDEAIETSPASTGRESGRQRADKIHFVGDGSGLRLFEHLSSTAKASLPRESGQSPPSLSPYTAAAIPPSSLPSWEVACLLAERFFKHVQQHHPVLPQSTVTSILERVYNLNDLPASPEDLYRINMIFAVSSVTLYRRGEFQQHPYGYFRTAQQYASQVSMIGSLDSIQNLLLIARFAMYYHINCSIWDISRACMRQCIELGLHRPQQSKITPLQEQTRRNVFWDCYVHDRYSSGILGRPYAIAEQDITVELPIEAAEDDISGSDASTLKDVNVEQFQRPNMASVFLFVVKLRRLSTLISTSFFSSRIRLNQTHRVLADAGRIRADLDRYLLQLKQLHESAPNFPDPKSLYERQSWYDFLVEKDRLTLLRGALAQLSLDELHPPRGLLKPCLDCAINVIQLYSAMFEQGHITWTRSYFQILFTSGLSIMYTVSILKLNKNDITIDSKTSWAHASHALDLASDLLQRFVGEMPDAARFAKVFEVLIKQYTGTRARPSRACTPPPPTTDNTAQNINRLTGAVLQQSDSATFLATRDDNREYDSFGDLGIGMSTNALQPVGDDHVTPQHEEDGLLLELGLDPFHNWLYLSPNSNNFLGNMEAGLGEYAWGAPSDEILWHQSGFGQGP